jgi:glycosyltransferase involved in cell wall biosynthesis
MSDIDLQTQPKVSVYIPTKNRPEMLERAINSVLEQTYKNIEILVSDDGSTDNTPELMYGLIKRHKNIVYLRSEESKGACHARNQAILAAKGDFVTGLDDDDRFLPNRIEVFVNSYRQEDAFLCSLKYDYDGRKLIPNHHYQRKIGFESMARRNCVGNQIFVSRKLLIDKSILFDERFPAWQDYDFFTNIISQVGSARRVYYRTYIQHTDHEKNRITNPKRILKGYLLFKNKYADKLNTSQRVSLIVNANILRNHLIGNKLIKMCWKSCNFYDLFRIYKKQLFGMVKKQ